MINRFDIWRVVDFLVGLASLGWAFAETMHGGTRWLIVFNGLYGAQCLLSAAFGWSRRIFDRLRPMVQVLLVAAWLR